MTISLTTVASTAYYTALAETGAHDGRAIATRAYVSYYERDILELPGRWHIISHADRHRGHGDPFQAIGNGAFIDKLTFEMLAGGRHPETGLPIVKGARGRRVQAIDLQVPMCKSASLLAMFGPPHVQKAVASAKQEADEQLLKYIVKKGLLVARKGAAGKRKIAITDIVAVQFGHLLSRELDPHLHDHWLILNLAQTADGEFVVFDTILLKKHLGAISALHRAWFAGALKNKIGCVFRPSGRNLEIDGIDDNIVAMFSKRRSQIEEESRRAGFDTAIDRVKAQRAAHKTRKRKRLDFTFPDLVQGWQKELQMLDHTPSTLWQSVESAAAAARDQSHEEDLRRRDVDAIAVIFQNDSVLSEIELLRHFAEARQCERGGDDIISILEALKRAGTLVTLDGGTAFTTPAMVQLEHRMLRNARALRGKWTANEKLLTSRSSPLTATLSDEQSAAVEHALGPDSVVVGEGRAGVGKSYILGAIADRVRQANLELLVLAPSWKAVEVARKDSGVAPPNAMAIQGFANALRNGTRMLGARDVILVDEAGMVDIRDMATLIEHAKDAGAKLILAGDTRQLAPVSAGAPMASLTQCLGSSRIEWIRRQLDPDERTASMHFAAGDIQRAMDIYARRGAIETHVLDRAALDAVVKRSVIFHREKHQAAYGARVPTQLVLASTRADVHALNAAIRTELVDNELVGKEAFTVKAIPRNEKKPVDLVLAVNDEIIFGEKVLRSDVTIYNGDVATVVAIEERAGYLELKLKFAGKTGNGQDLVVEGALSDFVGNRQEGEATYPVMQHAYARTVHGAQGATVDHVTIFNSRPLSKEALYVAMTRHSQTVKMVVAGARIADTLLQHDRYVDKAGKLKERERHLPLNAATLQAIVLARIVKDASRVKTAANLSAFVPDIAGWLSASDATAELRRQLERRSPQETAQEFIAQRRRRPQPAPETMPSPLRLNFAEQRSLGQWDKHAFLKKLFPSILQVPQAHRSFTSYLLGEAGQRVILHVKSAGKRLVWFSEGAVVQGSVDNPNDGPVKLAAAMWKTSLEGTLTRLRSVLDLHGLNPLAGAAERLYKSRTNTPRDAGSTPPTIFGQSIETTPVHHPPDSLNAEKIRRGAAVTDGRVAGGRNLQAQPPESGESASSIKSTQDVSGASATGQLFPIERLPHKKQRKRRESNALTVLHRVKRVSFNTPGVRRPHPVIER